MKNLFRIFGLFLLTAQFVLAQEIISGTVSDDQGVPLPGATILIQGTTNGVSTDFDGNFQIEGSQDDILEISFCWISNIRDSSFRRFASLIGTGK